MPDQPKHSPLPQTPEEWEKKCKESGGSMIMLPEALVELAKTYEQHFQEQQARAAEFAKSTYFWNKENNEFWCKVREAIALANPEIENIWGKDLGWNTFADEQGIKVVNLLDSRPGM